LQAEPLYRQNLESFRRTLGPEHPNALIAENNLATLLQIQGKLADAESLFRHILETRRRLL